MNKKGEAFQLLIGLATSVAALAVIMVITFLVLASGKKQIASIDGNLSSGYNSTVSMTTSVSDGIPPFLPIIILAGVGVVLIGLVSLFKAHGG